MRYKSSKKNLSTAIIRMKDEIFISSYINFTDYNFHVNQIFFKLVTPKLVLYKLFFYFCTR